MPHFPAILRPLALSLAMLPLCAAEPPAPATHWVKGVTAEKGWHDANKDRPEDGHKCWAATAANMLAWWQDRNPHLAARPGAPCGLGEIWDTFRRAFTDCPGETFLSLQWWFSGLLDRKEFIRTPYGMTCGGYYKDLLGGTVTRFPGQYLMWQNIAENSSARITELIDQGYAIGIGIRRLDKDKRILPVWHMLSLWGAETDPATGQITRVYLTDSDDVSGNWPKYQRGLFPATATMQEVTDEKGNKTSGLVLCADSGWFKDNCIITTIVMLRADTAATTPE